MARTERSATTRRSEAVDGPVRLALVVAVGWTLMEFGLRRGLAPHLEFLLGSVAAADWTILLVGFPAMAALLTWMALRAGRRSTDWDWAVSLRAIGAGLAGVVVALVATALA